MKKDQEKKQMILEMGFITLYKDINIIIASIDDNNYCLFFRVKIVKEIVFVNFKTVPTIYWVETQFQ